MAPMAVPAEDMTTGTKPPDCRVSAELERSLTQVARAILRLEVPLSELTDGRSVDRAGYWLLVRLSSQAPVRLSELADTVELDLSTVSRQMRDLVAIGLVVKVPDPDDGRASLLSLSERGRAVLGDGVRGPSPGAGRGHRRLDRRGARRPHPGPAPAGGRAPPHP